MLSGHWTRLLSWIYFKRGGLLMIFVFYIYGSLNAGHATYTTNVVYSYSDETELAWYGHPVENNRRKWLELWKEIRLLEFWYRGRIFSIIASSHQQLYKICKDYCQDPLICHQLPKIAFKIRDCRNIKIDDTF